MKKKPIKFILVVTIFSFFFLVTISFWSGEKKENFDNHLVSIPEKVAGQKGPVVVQAKSENKGNDNKNETNLEANTKSFEDEIKKYDAKFLLKDPYNQYYLSQNSLAIKLQDFQSSMGKKIQEWEGKWVIYSPTSMGGTFDASGVKNYPVILGSSQQGILIPLLTLKIFLKDKIFEEGAKNFIEQYSEKIEKTDYLSEIKTIYVHANSPNNMIELYKICLSENNSSEFTCAPEFYHHFKLN